MSSLAGSTPPMRNALYSPSSGTEPIRTGQAWAALHGVRWAGSGGRHDASWNDLPLDVWSCSNGPLLVVLLTLLLMLLLFNRFISLDMLVVVLNKLPICITKVCDPLSNDVWNGKWMNEMVSEWMWNGKWILFRVISVQKVGIWCVQNIPFHPRP